MTTKKSIKISLITIVLCTTTISCSKSDDKMPEPQAKECRIVDVSGLLTANMDYYENGRVKTIIYGTEQTDYLYIDATQKVKTTTTEDGEFVRGRTMTLNENGQIINIRTVYDPLGKDWSNNAYEYNGEQATKMVHTSSNGASSETYNYIWSNGNLISTIAPDGEITTFDYYVNEPVRQGDYPYLIESLEYGQSIMKNKNLLKSLTDSFGKVSFEYDFDDEGKIMSIAAQREGKSGAISFEYQCE